MTTINSTPLSDMKTHDSDTLLNSLRGQTIVLCDLNSIFDSWPKEINPNLDQLRHDVDVWLESSMDGPSLKALKSADFGFFGATWWPRANLERLRAVTFLAIWLFTWDDELDMDDGSLWDDFDRAQVFRTETLKHVRFCLGLSSGRYQRGAKPSSKIIRNFNVIGKAIRDVYDMEQRENLSYHMEVFMDMTEREQRLRMKGAIPSVEEYMKYRLGSSAVSVTLAVNEFAQGDMRLPRLTMEDANMKLLWDQTNLIISVVNDMLSLKKEIARNSFQSLIPLLYNRVGNAQAAVDQTTQILIEYVAGFEETAKRLLASHSVRDVGSFSQLQDFVAGCRFYCTGNLVWSLKTQRYGIECEDMSGGVEVCLE